MEWLRLSKKGSCNNAMVPRMQLFSIIKRRDNRVILNCRMKIARWKRWGNEVSCEVNNRNAYDATTKDH